MSFRIPVFLSLFLVAVAPVGAADRLNTAYQSLSIGSSTPV
jgi:hypothetical protein